MLARDGAALDTASKAYTQDAVVAITSNWNVDELWKRASPHLRQIATRDQMKGLLAAARDALGPMLEFRSSQGESLIAVNNLHKTVSARYVASGNFEKGDADFQIVLVKTGDDWMIEGFHINSPLLMQRMTGVRS